LGFKLLAYIPFTTLVFLTIYLLMLMVQTSFCFPTTHSFFMRPIGLEAGDTNGWMVYAT